MSIHSVIRTFLSRSLRYWLEIWYMDLSWLNTNQVWLLSRLTYFFLSYCPLQKFSFPNFLSCLLWFCFPVFSLSSFDILIWNFIYVFVLTYYRSRGTLVTFDLLLHELLPFAKISFSGLFSVIFRHIDLKFHMWICVDIIQIKFDFYVWPDCTPDIFFCLNLVFCTFLCCLARYWHQIWGLNLYWHNTENFS